MNQENNQNKLSMDWLNELVENNIDNLGHRYTPKLNVKLEISKKFDAVRRNDAYRKEMQEKFHEIILHVRKAEDSLGMIDEQHCDREKLTKAIRTLEDSYQDTQSRDLQPVNIELLKENCEFIKEILSTCLGFFEKENDKNKNDSLKYKIHKLREAMSNVYSFMEFLSDSSLSLANLPIMLLLGEAGIGKSHLLADVASNVIQEGKPCILLLGQHFTRDTSPWVQILANHIRLGYLNEDELLRDLNNKAMASGERLLFIIDAINEGQGCYFWPDHIKGFIRKFLKFPWLGLVLSVRLSYENLLVPENILSSVLAIKILHRGFLNIEYQASSFFFSQYGIEQPNIPLLHPEFTNPLFLKLFCEGLHRSGLSRIPKGCTGISRIIDFFLDSVDKKLSSLSHFDYPSSQKITRKVIDGLIAFKFENNTLIRIEQLSKELMRLQTNHDNETREDEKIRLEPLIEEKNTELDLLKKKVENFSQRELVYGRYIPYEKSFEIADNILYKFSNKKRFVDALISEGVLSKNLYWHGDGKYSEGIYLAYERFEDYFSTIHLLNKYKDIESLKAHFNDGRELDYFVNYYYRNQGILESLSIQIPEKFGVELYELVSDEKKSYGTVIEAFIYSMIWRDTSTIKQESKDYINKYILKYKESFAKFFQMVYSIAADPDHPYNANCLHNFLMSFSMANRDAMWTVFLHGQNYEGFALPRFISWALSDDNKSYLSDESRLLACKALAWLFTSTNIPLRDSATEGMVSLLENHVSIAEKLLREFENINDPYVYERIFSAIYGSVLRSRNLFSLDDLSFYIINFLFKKDNVYPNVLVRDYARNIIEYALYKDIVELDDIDLIRPPYKSEFPLTLPENDEVDSYKIDYEDKDFKDYYWSQNAILNSMRTEYGRGIGGYGDFGRYVFQSKVDSWDMFDPNSLSNYACKLIFETYGYDLEKHGKFDRDSDLGLNNRNKNITERIGKKYQWIALYEILARLCDNYQMLDDSTRWGNEKEYLWYQGTWEPFVRNIDPTSRRLTSKKTNKNLITPWWDNLKYNDWNVEHVEWLKSHLNLPCTKQAVEVIDSEGIEWLILDIHRNWEEPTPIGIDRYDHPHKELWMMTKSCLVKESDFQSLVDWLKDKSFMGRWFPEGRNSNYQVFSREYYWSPAYHFFDNPYYGGVQWREVCEERFDDDSICEVLPTSEQHNWESGTDYDEMPQYLSPVEFIFNGMQLQYSENIGEWLDSKGCVACFDPSIKSGGTSCLLVRKDIFQDFLLNKKLYILWTCLGEKQILGNLYSRNEFPLGVEFSGVFYLNENEVDGGITTILNG